MKGERKSTRFVSVLKPVLFLALAALSLNALAGTVYVGNPNRPDTVWIPAHCEKGCWKDGYYIKFVNPPVCCQNVVWAGDHWQPVNYRVVGIVK